MAALFEKVLDMSFTASIIILVVIAARYFLRKTPKVISYALWSVVLFRLLCPVSFTAPVSILEVTQPTVTITSDRTSSLSYLPEMAADTAEQPSALPVQNALPPETPAFRTTLKAWASLLWGIGAACMMASCLISSFLLSRRLIGATPYQGRAYLADHIPTPFVMGIWNPKIYIPSDTPKKEYRYILAHEQHHIHRCDHIVKLLSYGALCIHWFNPLVWLAFFLAGQDMEMSCDEAVIRKLGPEIRAAYAESLLRLGANRPTMAGIPLAFCEGDTKMRVKNIAKWKKPKVWVVMASLVLCAAVLVACGVNPNRQEPATAPESGQTEIAEKPEDSLRKCRTALNELQSSDSYVVKIQKTNYGENVLTNSTTSVYAKNGSDWLFITQVPDNGFEKGYAEMGYMYVDGICYSNLEQGWDENGEMIWAQVEANLMNTPWVAGFQWTDENVTYLSSIPAGSGECVTLQIQEPYNPAKDPNAAVYQTQFVLNGRSILERVENTVFFSREQGGDSLRETIEVVNTSAQHLIDQQYQRYTKES